VHTLDRVAVTHEVAPDDIRHRGIVVNHDDPARRIRVAYQRFSNPVKRQ